LVRGFNTEYSSVFFVFLFLGEYGFIIFFSFLTRAVFFQTNQLTIFFIFAIIWIRANYPRKRYDLLMEEIWLILFPIACLRLWFFITFFSL
jgi:NADH:ubiquinone oxidoreductase subunit H